MKRTNHILVAAIFASSLGLAGFAASVEAKDGGENLGQHKGGGNQHGKKFDHATHDRRDFGHHQKEIHAGKGLDKHHGRAVQHARQEDRHHVRHDGRIDNRGHNNKPEIRQDFKDIRNARNEVKQDRVDLRKDRIELNKDRTELRKDIRSGASKTEIAGDRKEIRDDLAKLSKDRAELKADQNKLNTARVELKNDLHKR
ncbi:MAG: hypothetical protein EXR70_12315 [Deltaproteobacteria bacterium]|nr:hypothetical protein [Deltaproteobacteria bacterium]